MRKLSSQGTLDQVVPGLVFVPEVMDPLTEIARQIAAVEEGIRAGAFRNRTGLGRERSIQTLESFDRVEFTRRVLDSERSFDRAQGPSVASALDRNRLRWGGRASSPVGASDAPGWVRLSPFPPILVIGQSCPGCACWSCQTPALIAIRPVVVKNRFDHRKVRSKELKQNTA